MNPDEGQYKNKLHNTTPYDTDDMLKVTTGCRISHRNTECIEQTQYKKVHSNHYTQLIIS